MDKLQAWEQRGRRPLTIQEVENVFNRHPFLPTPREVVILDGVIETGPSSVAVGATPVDSREKMILTPLSNEDTVVHEAIHRRGLGEIAAYGMTPVIMARSRFNLGLIKRDVKFQPTGTIQESELEQQYGLISAELLHEIQTFMRMQQAPVLPGEIKKYKLIM